MEISKDIENIPYRYRKIYLLIYCRLQAELLSSLKTIKGESVDGLVEHRQALRFPLTLPVDFEGGGGITRNISTSGVFFETDHVFSNGEVIRLTLLFGPRFPGIPTCLHCQGQIVRTERREGKVEVAVSFMSYRFERFDGGRES